MPNPTYAIDLNNLPGRNIVIPKADSVTFQATAAVQLNFGAPAGTGTPFSDGIDSFSVGPGSVEKEFSNNASGNYAFTATPEGGPTATGDIDVVAGR